MFRKKIPFRWQKQPDEKRLKSSVNGVPFVTCKRNLFLEQTIAARNNIDDFAYRSATEFAMAAPSTPEFRTVNSAAPCRYV